MSIFNQTHELQKDSKGNWRLGGSEIHSGSQVIEVMEFPNGSISFNQAVVDSEPDGTLFLTYAHIAGVCGPRLRAGMKLQWDPAYNS